MKLIKGAIDDILNINIAAYSINIANNYWL